MNMLYMKIHEYDESSHSLIVSFASDATNSQNPDDYPHYAYQPLHMWPDIFDPAEIKKRIAVAGMYHAEQQEREEKFVADPEKVQQYKNMVNTQASFVVAELTVTPDSYSNEVVI
jgi:hypothetical protein